MSKLEFNITEIPEGESTKELQLVPDDFDLSPYSFEGGDIRIDIFRGRRFIRVNYEVDADVEVVGDRSLEPFIYPVHAIYEVVFKTDVRQETENEGTAVRRFNFSDNTFSIEKEVRDSVMLEIPMQKIHPKYLDEEGEIKEFETKSFGDGPSPEEENEQKMDPRWEKLKKLKNNN